MEPEGPSPRPMNAFLNRCLALLYLLSSLSSSFSSLPSSSPQPLSPPSPFYPSPTTTGCIRWGMPGPMVHQRLACGHGVEGKLMQRVYVVFAPSSHGFADASLSVTDGCCDQLVVVVIVVLIVVGVVVASVAFCPPHGFRGACACLP
jgi:hypothetical protein